MKAKAAVCRSWGEPMTIEEIDVAPPKENEIMMKVVHSGLCHSDLSLWKGLFDIDVLPFVNGHECAGVVEEVGSGVTNLKQGDHVVAGLSAWCGRCKPCLNGMINICEDFLVSLGTGKLVDGTTRFRDAHGNPLNVNLTSGFSEYTVLPERMVVKIPDQLPLDQACLLSCCVPTGWGSAVRIAKITPGESVAVWGMGGIGLNIIQGARLSGADPIVAVDLESSKEHIALEMGATHFINSSKQDPVHIIRDLTRGKGVDCAFEAIGDPGAYLQAVYTIALAGKLVGVGIVPMKEMVTVPFYTLVLQQQKFMGSSYGGIRPQIDLPILADLAIKGNLKLKELITRHITLEEINEAQEAMENRKIVGRWVCDL